MTALGTRLADSPSRLLRKVVNRTIGRLVPPRLLARRYEGIPGRVHADDLMLRSEAPEHIAHYVSDAESAITNIADSLTCVGRRWADVVGFLDLPSGYGRVVRLVVQHVQPDKVTACDVDRQAVRFCVAEFGVNGVVAHRDPTRTRFPTRHDVGFVGSLLTHLPEAATVAVLRAIVTALLPGALLIFSTQGESCLDHLDWYGTSFEPLEGTYRLKVAQSGVWFTPYPKQRDYGVTIHSRWYVERLMSTVFADRIRLVRFAERGWDGHQDVWTYRVDS